MKCALVIAGLSWAGNARADLLSHDRLRSHVAALDVGRTTYDELDTSRITFSLSALVPGFGTYRLERRVFGEVRPAGVLGDWILGGLVPAGLAIGAVVANDPDTRAALAWTAAGLYVTTRLVILVVGNLHITTYRRALALRFAATPNTAGVSIAW